MYMQAKTTNKYVRKASKDKLTFYWKGAESMIRGTDSARVIEIIETRSCRGSGTQEDPCRLVVQYWSLEGELLAEKEGITSKTIVREEV